MFKKSIFSKKEKNMWDTPPKDSPSGLSDSQINEKYRAGEQRIVTETNREKIPNFVEALKRERYMQERPFYQRRQRWAQERRSRLIESFIMNIPVPPLFLYEKDFNKYEIMDGQQRVNALRTFYNNEYKLKGLQIWPEINNKSYSELPTEIRNGLDRRSISYVVVLKESTPNEEDAIFLRQTVFERLNTGGVKLERQEIRNCLFQGSFNDMLIDITRTDQFREAFMLPKYSEEENKAHSKINKYTMYIKMEDTELVLRFFALRHIEYYTRGMQGFLDLYMARALNFNEEDRKFLKNLYITTLDTAINIYQDKVFRPFDVKNDRWFKKPHKAFYDAVMVGLSNFIDQKEKLISKRHKIIKETKNLFISNPTETFTGRGNTKNDIQERINKFMYMISDIIE